MADGNNTTQFNVKVTADTNQAEQSVESLGDELDKTGKAAQSLRAEIRETTIQLQKLEQEGKSTGKEFQDLRSKLDDLNDAQERAAFKAGQFDDKLSAMPGPLGQAGNALKTFNDSVNQFGKTLTYSLGLVGLIVTAFIAVKNALEKTESGQKLLSQATQAFNKILAPIFVVLQKLGEFVLPKLIKGFELVGKAVEKVASIFGDNKDRIKEMNDALQENNEYANDLAAKDKKRADDAKALADKQKAEQDKRDAAAKKRREEQEAARAKQKAIDDEAAKIQTEAALSLLDARTRELKERELRFGEEKKKILASNNKDLTNLNKEYNLDLASINKKFADEQLEKNKKDLDENYKKFEEFLEKGIAAQEKAESEKRALTFQTIEGEISELDRLSQQYDNDFQADIDRLEQKKILVAEQSELALTNTKLTEAERLKIIQDAAQKERDIQKDITATQRAEFQARIDLQMRYADVVGQFGSVLQQAAGENKAVAIAGLLIEQAAGVAKIIINTKVGASAAFATGNIPLGVALIAQGALSVTAAVMAATKGIQQINAVNVPGGSSGGGGSVGGAPSIQAPRIGTAATPQMAEGVGANPSTQIAQTIGNAQDRPIKAYVVSQDITSQQMLDRKSNQAAVF